MQENILCIKKGGPHPSHVKRQIIGNSILRLRQGVSLIKTLVKKCGGLKHFPIRLSGSSVVLIVRDDLL